MKKTFYKTKVFNLAVRILIVLSPLVLFVSAYFGAILAEKHSSIPSCITFNFLGFYCPACGMTRSVIALMHGDILLSIRQNAMIVVFLVIGLIFYIWYILRLLGVKFRLGICNRKFLYGILILWFVYGISRNFIPFIAPI